MGQFNFDKAVVKNVVLYSGVATGVFTVADIGISAFKTLPAIENINITVEQNDLLTAYLADPGQSRIDSSIKAVQIGQTISGLIFGVSLVIQMIDIQ